MVNERVLAVPYTTIFIAELPEETQNIIREDLKQHAREHNYRLEWDRESKDYVGMSHRFCDVEDIYRDTELHFCEAGEDIEPYKRSVQRNISINLHSDEVEELCVKAGKVGLSVSKLLENFVADLIEGTYTNGSDERMYISRWFNRCWFSIMSDDTFLAYLLNMGEMDGVLESWEKIQELKVLENPDAYDKEELETEQEYVENCFKDYREYTREPIDKDLETAMEKVLAWNQERKNMLKGNVPEKSRER